jgi:hypothetical protein
MVVPFVVEEPELNDLMVNVFETVVVQDVVLVEDHSILKIVAMSAEKGDTMPGIVQNTGPVANAGLTPDQDHDHEAISVLLHHLAAVPAAVTIDVNLSAKLDLYQKIEAHHHVDQDQNLLQDPAAGNP